MLSPVKQFSWDTMSPAIRHCLKNLWKLCFTFALSTIILEWGKSFIGVWGIERMGDNSHVVSVKKLMRNTHTQKTLNTRMNLYDILWVQ
jgi:hypothetical protein